MSSKQSFLRWALTMSVVTIGLLIAASLGWLSIMYNSDVTKLSSLILVVFLSASSWCGMLAWRLEDAFGRRAQSSNESITEAHRKLTTDAEHGWFAAGICEKLGLTGTLFGLVYMLMNDSFTFSGATPESIQALINLLMSGMSTAFITTLVGILCNILLLVQYHMLDQSMTEYKK